ncbi:carboxymuconolactone decarboxylase family protein [Mycolicibacterium fortuitum]
MDGSHRRHISTSHPGGLTIDSDTPPERIYDVFNKRTYSIRQLRTDLRRVSWTTGGGIWFRHKVDRQTREAIMLAVSHAHNCRYCAFIHREWALHTGLPLSVISGIEGHADSYLEQTCDSPRDPRWLATTYAEALVRVDFGPVAPLLETAVAVEFDPAQRRRIEAIARIMTIFNRSANTFDALLARISGEPVEGSRLRDELVVSMFAWTVTLPMVLAISLIRRESPSHVMRRFRHSSRQ